MRMSDWSSDVCSSDLGPNRMFFYPWAQTRAALELARRDGADPYEGVSVRLSDPTTGRYAMPTIDYCAKLLPAGGRTPDRKSVVEGKRVAVSVDLGGRRVLKKKQRKRNEEYSTI